MDKQNLKLLSGEIPLLLNGQPGLRILEKNSIPSEILGNYAVRDDRGVVQETYEIRVLIPSSYPYGFPVMVETSEKIERIIDRHISEEGIACLEMDRKIAILSKYGITLQQFFQNYVHKFLCWQILYDEGEKDQLTEWSHHEGGVVEFYLEYMNMGSKELAKDCLQLIIDHRLPGRNALCPCGSERKMKRCHEKIFDDLKLIGRQQLIKDLQLFLSNVSKAA
jgi:hypothetical protein